MTTYEVRADDDHAALPMGVSTLSVHDSADEAWAWIDDEEESFRRHLAETGQTTVVAFLQRLVVEIDDDGEETRVRRDMDEEGW